MSLFRVTTREAVYNYPMSKKRPQNPKQDQKTTVMVAVGTFVALSLVSLVAWAIMKPPAATAPAPQAAAVP